MRTIRTKVYQFNELDNKAKEKAIEWFRYSDDSIHIYSSELIDSVKELAELFNLKIGNEYTDLRTSHIEDNILELSGVRLYKYLVNNYYNSLFKPKYIKLIHRKVNWRQFVCKPGKGINGEFTQIYSKINRVNDGCPLTGICYDNDILQPVYDFLKKIDKTETFEGLINSIESAIRKSFRDIEEWVNSDEYIIDAIVANEYEFTAEGNIF